MDKAAIVQLARHLEEICGVKARVVDLVAVVGSVITRA
jgi:hypothetical protein